MRTAQTPRAFFVPAWSGFILLQKEFAVGRIEYIQCGRAEARALAMGSASGAEGRAARPAAKPGISGSHLKRLEERDMNRIPEGVYPVMITPFTDENAIDWPAVDGIVEFYARMGCQGIFAVCQSSEMFCLSEDERVLLAERVARASAGRMCVVASGHVSEKLDDQIRELTRISRTGVDAVVMISNRLAGQDESDETAIKNMNAILDALPGVTFGMYECPHPFKRPLTDLLLEAMAESGRFAFIKDTCCSAPVIAHRMGVLRGSVQLFNANAATLLESLRDGAAGFSGIMANYHPDLYVWLTGHFRDQPERARRLAAALSVLSAAEGHCHPVCTKDHMNRSGVPMKLHTRSRDERGYGELDRHFIEDLMVVEDALRAQIPEK